MGGHVNSIWTDEQSDALKDFLADGLSFSQIAAALNEKFETEYSRNAVCGRAWRLQVKALPKIKVIAKPKKAKRKPSEGTVKPALRAEEIRLRCVVLDPLHLTIEQLEPGCCRYPFGDGPFTFCGHPKQDGSSYCPAHEHLCHGPAPRVSALEVQRRRLHWKKLQGLATVFPMEAAE